MTQAEIQKFMEQRIPHYTVTLFGTMAFDLLLSCLMIAAGFGLIQMRRWGRNLSISYAVVSIVQKLFAFVYTMLVVGPTMTELYETMFQRLGPAGQPFGGFAKMGGTMASASAFFQLSYMIYPISVLVVMFLPSVRAAFRGDSSRMKNEGPYYGNDVSPIR
jgi:hypothetical protein